MTTITKEAYEEIEKYLRNLIRGVPMGISEAERLDDLMAFLKGMVNDKE